MDFDKVLHIATFAGRIILESGGETYRVEETICRICAAYGIRYAESFVTPTGIMVSVYDENNYTTTLVKELLIELLICRKSTWLMNFQENFIRKNILLMRS